MRRSDRAQDRDFALAVIDSCTHGVVAMDTGEPTPYCIPLSLARIGDSLYFHGARQGRKAELLDRNSRVCVTFVSEDRPTFVAPAMYTTYYKSAVVTGTVVKVENEAEKEAALRAICEKMTPEDMGEGFDKAIARSLKVTAVWRIDMDSISGKAKL